MAETEGVSLKRLGWIRNTLLVVFVALRCIVAHDLCVKYLPTLFVDDDWFWAEMKRILVMLLVYLWAVCIVFDEGHWYQRWIRTIFLSTWLTFHVFCATPLWSTPQAFWQARENLRGCHGIMMFLAVP